MDHCLVKRKALNSQSKNSCELTQISIYFLFLSYDAGKNFELCVDFFDLLEGIIQVKSNCQMTFQHISSFMGHSIACLNKHILKYAVNRFSVSFNRQ